ncbi:DUF1700 domain-containing protein [Bradyrhizobium sp. CCGUVB1N3]|uniref:DUF1700 domain-containing protein n=1 Tax=Bradyrhizobium sp. CCGUVB1N3 TaxID=2949629 RepID=UPI0020B3B1CC|nr:DUF1700 domain-containing protein [Bradyrhizobium sp. CCGUVB1N3]MCP3472853.1 DUF1700 domain-containing protein [Bradyrhizobium sp. CCGUVB1N3]
MNRADFLRILRDGLAGLPREDVDDVLADYAAHFEDARASGRPEEEVAEALGEPRRLARELRAETGLRRWENHHSLQNSTAALLALGGLALVDVILLLPLLLVVMLILLIIAFVMLVLGIVGIGLLISLYKHAGNGHIVELVLRGLAGIALVTTGAGFGALLLLGLNAAVRWLGGYARLHYRLLKPEQPIA